ncbi:sodium:solute symporter family transporter [Panacagrimonas sp.]|uniref:sodium:solute symporter family transporter n=1 Tax=Panacagrimonas sp. TaxID=2480088 RepID=UPI003B51E186
MGVLHPLDYGVLAAYVVFVIVVGVLVARRSPDSDELFLAGRSLGFGVVGLSLFASNISSTTLIGLPGAAWEHGIAVANYEWMAALVLVFSAVFVVPMLLRHRVTTIPQWLEQRFDARMRKYLSGVAIFLSVVLDTAGSLYAGAVVLDLFVPGLTLGWTCAGIAVFVGLYTAAGGLRAVAYTDVMQVIVLMAGSLMLTVIVFGEFDYSWANVKAAIPDDHLSLIRPLDDAALPWLGTLIGLPVLGFYYWTMNQYVSQRVLAARDQAAAGYGALLAAFLKLLPLFLMVLPGAMAISLLPDLDRADSVFPALIAEYAPVGLAGLILAGLLAAIMSSIDSALNSASTLISVDFVLPRRPNTTPQQLAFIGRGVTFGLVAFAAVWAPAIDNFPGLFAYLQQGFAYVTPPLVAVFLLGVFTQRLGARGALYATLCGHAVSAAWFVATQMGLLDVHFTIVAGGLFLFTLAVAWGWSVTLGESANAGVGYVRGAIALPAGVKAGALGLLALTVTLVLAFW